MKLIKFCGAVLVALSMTSLAHAGLLGHRGACGAEKGCGCAPTCQPACCKPVIVKPCCPNVYTYQRRCSDIKPPCCDTCGAPPSCCAPASNCGPACAPACAAPAACAPACAAPAACAPACAAPAACAPACAAPAACAPACAAPAACGPATCAAPCAPTCAAPTSCAPACATGCGKRHFGLFDGLLRHPHKGCGDCAPTCGAPASCAAPTCAAPAPCCNADPCEIACLIYESQTACYAKDRRKAIEKLGNKYDCICNPEIMTAFIVALNDCDERVRKEAADEIGDQVKKHCCCCPEVVAALTCALADCDKGVRKQAVEALERCGYEVVDGCCDTCAAGPACGVNGCAPAAGAPAPMNGTAPAPAPVPPQGAARAKSGMSQLLGLLD